MIDYFALALTHTLIVIALLRMLVRPDLDREDFSIDEAVAEAKQNRREARRARRQGKEPGDA